MVHNNRGSELRKINRRIDFLENWLKNHPEDQYNKNLEKALREYIFERNRLMHEIAGGKEV